MRELEDRQRMINHAYSLERRERAVITGAEELLSFNEEEVSIQTTQGLLVLEGEDLHIERLNLEEGQIVVRGYVSAAVYKNDGIDMQSRGGVFGKLFRR